MHDSSCDIRIQVNSQATFVCAVRAALETAAHKVGLDDKACGHITLAVTEAVANIINHGYKGQDDKPIWVTLKTIEKNGQTGITIIIEDECPQVDLAKIKSRPLEDYRPGGLGVHIIKEVMQDVSYAHRPGGKGLILTMTKFPSPPEAPETPESPEAAEDAEATSQAAPDIVDAPTKASA